MDSHHIKRKEFLLRKNKGRLESDELLFHLKKCGIHKAHLVELSKSDNIIQSMQKGTIIKEGYNMHVDAFVLDIQNILEKQKSLYQYLWIDKSVYCGLISLSKLPDIEIIISILADIYFGGYFSIYFPDANRRLDIDVDEDPEFKNKLDYSYCFSIIK